MSPLAGARAHVALIVCVLVASATGGRAAGPREPLTFKNMGLYGPWNSYFVSKSCPFDYFIVQATIGPDGRLSPSWNENLKLARANGKRIIADLGTVGLDKDKQEQAFASLYNLKDPPPIEQFLPLFDRFFEQVDTKELYAVTIGEEHVFWNGQKERLVQVYQHLKQRHPDVPIYQWFSPSNAGSTPGLNWPNLPADGWMKDEYYLEQPAMEQALRMHRLMNKPVFQTVWAAPDCKSVPWSEKTFWDQYSACRKYDVPIAFFCWSARDAGAFSDKWGWDPQASPAMRQVFENSCIAGMRLAQRLPGVPRSEWDFVPATVKPVALTEDPKRPGVVTYTDDFTKVRESLVWNDARVTGFEHLHWDSSPIELKPGSSEAVQASLRYCFDLPAQPKRISVVLSGNTSGGDVELALADAQENVIATSTPKNGVARVDFDATAYLSARFHVICTLKSGTAEAGSAAPTAQIRALTIECELRK